MSTQPRPVGPLIGSQVRADARRGARALSGGLIALLAGGVALIVVLGFVVLDYRFNQDAHRLVKMLGGMAGGLFIVLQPYLGLWLLPVTVPFLDWLPELPIPGLNTLNALLLSVFGLWALTRVLGRQPIGRPTILAWPIGILMVMVVVSWVRGAVSPVSPDYTFLGNAIWVFRTAMTFAPYVITLLMVRGRRDRAWLSAAIVVGLVAESITTVWFGRWTHLGRAYGSMAQPNVLGAYLVISTAFAFSMFFAAKKWWLRLALLGAVFGGSYAAILTISRAAMIALSVAGLYVSVRSSKVVTVLILVTLATSPLWAPENVKDRVMSSQQQVEDTDETQLEGSVQARIDTWNTSVEIAKKHLIDGVGFGAIGYILRDTGARLGLTHAKDNTHNTFMRVLAEMGLPGLALFLYLIWRCFLLSLTGLGASRTRFDRQLAIGLGAATLAVAINSWFGDRFFEFDIMCAFWMMCALVNDVIDRQHEEEVTA